MDAPSPRRFAGAGMVAAAALSWGTWSIFVRASNASAIAAAAVPFLLMGLFAVPFAVLEKVRPRWNRRNLLLTVAMAGLAACNLLTFFSALKVTTVAVATLTHYLAPILVACLAPWIEGDRNRAAIPAALAGFAGLAIILGPSAIADHQSGLVVGAALGFASAISYALLVFVVRRLEPEIGAGRVIAYQGTLAFALLLPIAAPGILSLDGRGWAILAVGALIPGTLAGLVFVRGLARIGSARAAVIAFCEPLMAVLIGLFVWGEPVGPTLAIGAVLIVAGGVAVSLRAS